MFKKRYRIVTDKYLGFECQERYLFSWRQLCEVNSFSTLDKAENFIKEYKKEYKNKNSFKQEVVKYID